MKHLYVRRASAGSGKTYTLAAHYIALLLHGEHYHSILAVTFTNKATAEMKERILSYLYSIARRTNAPDTQSFLRRVREIYGELGYSSNPEEDLKSDFCAKKAEALFTTILSDYDGMRVSTIDTFLQTLLAGMVQKLGQAVGYNVELDIDTVLSRAVDSLLSEGAVNADVRKAIIRYMNDRMLDEKNWDIRPALIQIAKELYQEQLQQNADRIPEDEALLDELKQTLEWRHLPEVAELKALLPTISVDKDTLKYGGDFVEMLLRMRRSLDEQEPKKENWFRGLPPTRLAYLASPEEFRKACKKAVDPQLYTHLCRVQTIATLLRPKALRYDFCTRHLNDLRLMRFLRSTINEALRANNSRLLAVTANTLAKALRPGDADFILEKAGIRYKHIMLDEFQDTSTLQWVNFSLLLQEILSTEEGSTLIVGDIKQSIYRWRNGNWTIMANLPHEWPHHYCEPPALTRNFRSRREVVHFNLETFRLLSAAESDDVQRLYDENYHGEDDPVAFYAPPKDEKHPTCPAEGYVRFCAFASSAASKDAAVREQVKEQVLLDMFRRMEALLAAGVPQREMLILIRFNKEAQAILECYNRLCQDPAFPCLAQTQLISSDSFVLSYSQSVNTLVAALRYIFLNDAVAAAYVHLSRPHFDLSQLPIARLRHMALIDLFEELVRQVLPVNNQLPQDDIAYLNAFRDRLKNYVRSNGSDPLAFLRYWDDTMQKKAIPAADSEGIRILSIHGSKGLEAGNVFIPFADWKMEDNRNDARMWCSVHELQVGEQDALLPIPQGSNAVDAGFADDFKNEHHLQRIDNLNLLYVALTRAADRLYIWSSVSASKEREKWSVGALLTERCELLDDFAKLDSKGGPNDYVAREWGTEFLPPAPPEESEESKESEESNETPKEKTVDPKPFSFSKADPIPSVYHSSDSHILFRQSQEGRKYGWNSGADDALPVVDRKAFGTICHDILSALSVYPTAEACRKAAVDAVAEFRRKGIIPSDELKTEMQELVLRTVSHPVVSQWFIGRWQLMREDAILFLGRNHQIEERRPDRVMIAPDGSEAIVLDYKFGHMEASYKEQVRIYIDLLHRMGYPSVRGYLFLATTSELIKIVQ